jgi:hypothetical protein
VKALCSSVEALCSFGEGPQGHTNANR